MPVKHEIDDKSKLIKTNWSGEPSDAELIESFIRYQSDVRSKPGYDFYNELVDFSEVSGVHVTVSGVKELVEIATRTDKKGVSSKLAIIVTSPLAVAIVRMYEILRSAKPTTQKKIRVFKNLADAYEWII
jgi:hypothetical protein